MWGEVKGFVENYEVEIKAERIDSAFQNACSEGFKNPVVFVVDQSAPSGVPLCDQLRGERAIEDRVPAESKSNLSVFGVSMSDAERLVAVNFPKLSPNFLRVGLPVQFPVFIVTAGEQKVTARRKPNAAKS